MNSDERSEGEQRPKLRVLVCGGRDYDDYGRVLHVLDDNRHKIERICHGGAAGADSLAGRWARTRNIGCTVYPADWRRHGKAAGPIRNQAMLDQFKPDAVIAFPGGRGTAHMVSIARAAGVEVHEVPS